MLRNVQRLRAQYHQSVQDRAHKEKVRAEKGKDTLAGETLDDRMDEDDVGEAGEKQAKRNPTEMSKKNVRKPRNRLGAIKWVKKLGQLLETQND